jgi:hypothetical protein
MTSGSRHEKVSLPRSAGGFHDVQACTGVFLAMRWMMLGKVPVITTL